MGFEELFEVADFHAIEWVAGSVASVYFSCLLAAVRFEPIHNFGLIHLYGNYILFGSK